MNRFVNIQELKDLYRKRYELHDNIRSYHSAHCKKCGDTAPKHGFYPLFSFSCGPDIIETSSLICNRCAISDEEYEKTFGEKKEVI